jgi:enoyl-CoA hydratase
MNNSETYTGIDDLTVSLSDGVLSVTLNRPDSLNSLTAPMLATIGTTLERAATDARVRWSASVVQVAVSVPVRHRGRPRHPGQAAPRPTCSRGEPRRPRDRGTAKAGSVRRAGPGGGVGVSLAISADIVLASDKAYFLLAFTKIGLMPDGGASALVAAAIGRTGRCGWPCWPNGCRRRRPRGGPGERGVPGRRTRRRRGSGRRDVEVRPAVALRRTKQAINAATLTGSTPHSSGR